MKLKHQLVSSRPVVQLLQCFLFLLAVLLCLIVGYYFSGTPICSSLTYYVESNTNVKPLEIKDVISAVEVVHQDCPVENYIFGKEVKQTDPCLIEAFKKKLLKEPPPVNERNPSKNITKDIPSNIEKLKWIEKLLIENKTGVKQDPRWPGFFVDCGANDGEFISATINVERKHSWTGLLVEANPTPFEKLLQTKRNVWAANVAACTKEYPQQLPFYTDPVKKTEGRSGLKADPNGGITENITVQCIPMYTMLAALNVTVVDYLSLDVEGYELDILKTIPFDRIMFNVMMIEYVHIPGQQKALKDFLEPKGYRFVKEISDSLTLDCLYVHESLQKKAMDALSKW